MMKWKLDRTQREIRIGENKEENESLKTGQAHTRKEEKVETSVNCKVWMSNLWEHPQLVMGLLIIIPLGITLKSANNI